MIKIMMQLSVCLIIISITSRTGASTSAESPPLISPSLQVQTLDDDGYVLHASKNSKILDVKSPSGLQLHIIIEKNKFLVSASDADDVPLKKKCRTNEPGQVQFYQKPTVKKTCDERKFPDGYIPTVGIGAHKYHRQKRSWNDARKRCIDEGGHLVVINSDDEEMIVREHMDKGKWPDTWVGVHDLYSSREWVTVQDVSLNQTGWATWSPLIVPNPDNHGGNQHCVRLLKSGGMDDLDCDKERHFVCEIPCDYCLSYVDPLDLIEVV